MTMVIAAATGPVTMTETGAQAESLTDEKSRSVFATALAEATPGLVSTTPAPLATRPARLIGSPAQLGPLAADKPVAGRPAAGDSAGTEDPTESSLQLLAVVVPMIPVIATDTGSSARTAAGEASPSSVGVVSGAPMPPAAGHPTVEPDRADGASVSLGVGRPSTGTPVNLAAAGRPVDSPRSTAPTVAGAEPVAIEPARSSKTPIVTGNSITPPTPPTSPSPNVVASTKVDSAAWTYPKSGAEAPITMENRSQKQGTSAPKPALAMTIETGAVSSPPPTDAPAMTTTPSTIISISSASQGSGRSDSVDKRKNEIELVSPKDSASPTSTLTSMPTPAPSPITALASPVATAPTAPVAPPPVAPSELAAPLIKLRTHGDGDHEMTIMLHPADLGQVNVHVRLTGSEMTIQLASANESAHAALHDALPQLRTELQNAGLSSTVDLSLDVNPQSGSPDSQRQPQTENREPVSYPVDRPNRQRESRSISPTSSLDRWL